MMSRQFGRHGVLSPYKNKTRTELTTLPSGARGVTTYLGGEAGPFGALCGIPFCGRLVAPNSAYCQTHGGTDDPPEVFDENDEDRLAGLDLPHPVPGFAE